MFKAGYLGRAEPCLLSNLFSVVSGSAISFLVYFGWAFQSESCGLGVFYLFLLSTFLPEMKIDGRIGSAFLYTTSVRRGGEGGVVRHGRPSFDDKMILIWLAECI